ncbi:MAG: 7,8-didemethyl-8-hydroxy-5-deazariboflavin synthase subunit CofG [Cyanobacteria bacterium P01_A01_bin.135]
MEHAPPEAGRVTYSPAYTLVPTYECYNRCAYCNFRVDPGRDTWLTLAEARDRLRQLPDSTSEILILSGEVHPASARRQLWLERIYDLCELALGMGFLPHTNAGPLLYEEMRQLRQVNVSMGLMVEQVTPQLMETVHQYAPSKCPQVRLQQLAWAGELKIPFTTGLLLGLGETEADWRDSLTAIAQSHRQWGHIQEVILQPHSTGHQQPWVGEGRLADAQLLRAVAIARELLPDDVTIQVPPNLMSPTALLACLASGARDVGGIVPKDEVNPDYLHRHQMRDQMRRAGWVLQPRLPVYPQYDGWLAAPLRQRVDQWRERLAELVS